MRRHMGRGIWEEASGRRHLGGCIWEKPSRRRHLGDGIWEGLWEGSGVALGWLWGGSGRALGTLWDASGKPLGGALGALAAPEAPGVAGRVSLHKQAPLCNRNEKFPFFLLLRSVSTGTTHQVPYMATFGDRRLEAGVGAATAPLPTPPGPYQQKLFRG